MHFGSVYAYILHGKAVKGLFFPATIHSYIVCFRLVFAKNRTDEFHRNSLSLSLSLAGLGLSPVPLVVNYPRRRSLPGHRTRKPRQRESQTSLYAYTSSAVTARNSCAHMTHAYTYYNMHTSLGARSRDDCPSCTLGSYTHARTL